MESQPYHNSIKYLQVILISFAILGFQMVSILPEVVGVESRIVTVPYRAFYLVIVMLVIFLFRWQFKINKYFVPILAFIFFYFIRSVYDSITKYDELKHILVDFWLFAYLIGFFPMIPLLFKVNTNTLNTAKAVLFVMVIIVNILGFKNNYGSFGEENIGARFFGNEILNQITYGQTGVIMVIMCLSYFYSQKLIGKLVLLPFIGLGLMNLAFAGSRGPMIELSLAIICFIVVNFKKIGAINLTIAIIFFISLGIYFRDYLIFFNTILDRLQDTRFNQGNGSEERYFLFKNSWEQFWANPVFGYVGIGEYPHNLILEAFMALGFAGGILMIYIVIIAFRNCIALVKIETTNWIALIFLMHIIAAFISGSIWNSFEFWSLLALSFSLYQHRNLYLT
ncbi:O-antigen ligase family protein [Aquirufa ecclesiirivi]